MTEGQGKRIDFLKAGFTLLLAAYGIVCARSDDGTFLDRVDLIAHEAGHLLFGFLGEFPMVMGGTLGQLLVPAGIAAYFMTRREFFSATVALFWTGQNLLNISRYVKDAAAMELPLVNIGGGEGIHDWNWLLLRFNLLRHDQTIGTMVYLLGVLTMVLAVLLGLRLSFERETADEDSVRI